MLTTALNLILEYLSYEDMGIYNTYTFTKSCTKFQPVQKYREGVQEPHHLMIACE